MYFMSGENNKFFKFVVFDCAYMYMYELLPWKLDKYRYLLVECK